jgi:hydrogenase nickel incorporation protein HypB
MAERKIVTAREEESLDIEVGKDLILMNERIAAENLETLNKHGILAVDVMGSVGAGKTALIEVMVDKLKGKSRVAMIAGDVTTTIDADRVTRHGVPSVQINTGRECHLDANMIRRALTELDLKALDLIFVENVGNLICPADYTLGCHRRLVVVSVTEGEWMIVKHPLIFKSANVAAINKLDLVNAMGVDVDKLAEDAKSINPRILIARTSAKTGQGIDELLSHLGFN